MVPRSTGVHRDSLSGTATVGIKLSLPNFGKPFEHSIFVGFRVKKFVLDVEWFTVKRLDFDVVGGFNYDLAFKGEIAAEKFLLGTFTLGTIPIGPVPIVPIVFPTLDIGASVKFGGSVGFDLPTHASYSPEKGFDLGIDPTRNGVMKDILDPNGAGASLGAEAKLSFPVKALAFGVAGPYIGPVLGLSGEVTFTKPPADDNPCNELVKACGVVKASFGGEYGIGCPWIEAIDYKREITAAEVTLYDSCASDGGDAGTCADSGTTIPDGDAGTEAGPVDDGGASTVPPDVQELADRLGVPPAVLADRFQPVAISQVVHSSASVPPKAVAGDHTTITGFFAGLLTLDPTTIAALSCGAGPGAGRFTVCPPGSPALPPGAAFAIIFSLGGPVPFTDTGNLYQYGFVFDANGVTMDNYTPSAQYPNDFFGGTDFWLEADRTAAGVWSLNGTNATGGTQTAATTSARIFIAGSAIGLVVPTSEMSVTNPSFRGTAFRHTGDYGMNPPYDWDGSLYPAVADGLQPFPP